MVRSTVSTFTLICKSTSRRLYTRFLSVFSRQILIAVRSDLSAGWCGCGAHGVRYCCCAVASGRLWLLAIAWFGDILKTGCCPGTAQPRRDEWFSAYEHTLCCARFLPTRRCRLCGRRLFFYSMVPYCRFFIYPTCSGLHGKTRRRQ